MEYWVSEDDGSIGAGDGDSKMSLNKCEVAELLNRLSAAVDRHKEQMASLEAEVSPLRAERTDLSAQLEAGRELAGAAMENSGALDYLLGSLQFVGDYEVQTRLGAARDELSSLRAQLEAERERLRRVDGLLKNLVGWNERLGRGKAGVPTTYQNQVEAAAAEAAPDKGRAEVGEGGLISQLREVSEGWRNLKSEDATDEIERLKAELRDRTTERDAARKFMLRFEGELETDLRLQKKIDELKADGALPCPECGRKAEAATEGGDNG